MTLTDCVVSGNSAAFDGGAIGGSGGTMTLAGCTISGNSAVDGGGGISDDDCTLTLTACTVSGNTAGGTGQGGGGGAGGGLLLQSDTGTTVLLTNTTITGNSAGSGGGLRDSDNLLTLNHCTVSGNSAATAGSGGGIYNFDSATDILDSIVAGNTGGGSPDDVLQGINGGVNASTSLFGPDNVALGIGNGNITLSSVTQLGLTPLGNYGGPTQTMALLPGSFALGNANPANGVSTDQRGEPLDSPNPDIGAFQSQGFTVVAVANGTPQKTPTGVAFANPLGVTVKANNPVEPVTGGIVTFTVPFSGASAVLSSNTATIQADGTASVTATANSIVGSYSVTAAVSESGSGLFSLTNLGAAAVTVTDASGTYNGSPFPATATVTGSSGIPSSSLEGVTPTLTYYAGSTAAGTPLAGAPSAVGTYTVVANFPGSTDYDSADSSPVTFSHHEGDARSERLRRRWHV